MKLGGALSIGGLLSFNGGFVDVTSFLGLHGLFSSHITGNFATLCASVVFTHQGILSKILAFPEFFAAVMLTHLASLGLTTALLPTRRILLAGEAVLLAAYLALGVGYGPFPDADSIPALIAAAFAIAAMAVQNAAQISQFRQMTPTSYMTRTAVQVAISIVDVLVPAPVNKPLARRQLRYFGLNLVCFGAGALAAAVAFWSLGFSSVAIIVPIALVAAVLPT